MFKTLKALIFGKPPKYEATRENLVLPVVFGATTSIQRGDGCFVKVSRDDEFTRIESRGFSGGGGGKG